MLLATHTYTLVNKFGYEKAFAMIKNAGFDAVDYSLFYDPNRWLLQDDYLEKARAIRKAMDAAGLVCRQTHSPFEGAKIYRGLEYGDPWTEDCPEYLETIRGLEVSAILGANHTVVHNLETPEGVDIMEYNYQFYKSLQPYAEKFDIKIAIENIFSKDLEKKIFPERIGSAENMNALYKRLNSDRFVLLVDTGHARIANIQPQDLIRELTPGALQGLHIQDTDTTWDRHLPPYASIINWEAVMQALKDTGYQGDFTYELAAGSVPDQLAESFLAYTAAIGRYLIKRFNEM